METNLVPVKKTIIWATIILTAAAIRKEGADVFQMIPFIILLSFAAFVLVAWGVEEILRR